jgi:hypothetical protein
MGYAMPYLVRAIQRDGSEAWLGRLMAERLHPLSGRKDAAVFVSRRDAKEAAARAGNTIPQSCTYEIISVQSIARVRG